MARSMSLGDLQLAIMRRLWARGEATVAEVHADLEKSRGLAPTTIATMLKKLEKKGAVGHRKDGRRFIYRPLLSESAVTRSMVSDLARRLFAGDVGALVSHLISEHEVDTDELAAIKKLIHNAEKERK